MKECPLQVAEQRLADAARLWEKANESYFSPNDFRTFAQSCIQGLRTVTWILQNRKHELVGFDEWYGTRQESMRSDAVLRWLVNARNRIEKQGDLITLSQLKVTFSASWHDGLEHTEDLAPTVTLDEVGPLLLAQFPPLARSGEALLRIERRWVDSDLPDTELLKALSHCYSSLSELLRAAHKHFDLRNAADCCKLVGHSFDLPEIMLQAERPRVLWGKLQDQQVATVTSRSKEFSPEDLDAAATHYGFTTERPKGAGAPSSFKERCEFFFEGRAMLFL